MSCDGCGDPCAHNPEELRHLPLYVMGSEGVHLCLTCRMLLTEVVRHMRHVMASAKIEFAKNRIKEETAQQKI
jgi:hypothetical protein